MLKITNKEKGTSFEVKGNTYLNNELQESIELSVHQILRFCNDIVISKDQQVSKIFLQLNAHRMLVRFEQKIGECITFEEFAQKIKELSK